MINSIDTKEWKNDESCTCNTSKFCDPFHKHIVKGDLNVIENRNLRHLLMKGPIVSHVLSIGIKLLVV